LFDLNKIKLINIQKWGLGIGDGGWGMGDWGLGPIPNPQSPIPNPQSPFNVYNFHKINNLQKLI